MGEKKKKDTTVATVSSPGLFVLIPHHSSVRHMRGVGIVLPCAGGGALTGDGQRERAEHDPLLGQDRGEVVAGACSQRTQHHLHRRATVLETGKKEGGERERERERERTKHSISYVVRLHAAYDNSRH